MRVHSIAVTPIFGYNKVLNDEVNTKLEQSARTNPYDGVILRSNRLCMQMEDAIRCAHAKRQKKTVANISAFLDTFKVFTTVAIENRFPNMNY